MVSHLLSGLSSKLCFVPFCAVSHQKSSYLHLRPTEQKRENPAAQTVKCSNINTQKHQCSLTNPETSCLFFSTEKEQPLVVRIMTALLFPFPTIQLVIYSPSEKMKTRRLIWFHTRSQHHILCTPMLTCEGSLKCGGMQFSAGSFERVF